VWLSWLCLYTINAMNLVAVGSIPACVAEQYDCYQLSLCRGPQVWFPHVVTHDSGICTYTKYKFWSSLATWDNVACTWPPGKVGLRHICHVISWCKKSQKGKNVSKCIVHLNHGEHVDLRPSIGGPKGYITAKKFA
jgi:hypothetical protein